MVVIQKKYAPKRFHMIAINAKDAKSYPEDSYSEMVKTTREDSTLSI